MTNPWNQRDPDNLQTVTKEKVWANVVILYVWDSEHNSVVEEKRKKKWCRKAGRISDIYWTLWLQLYWQTSGFVCRWGHYFVLTYSTWQIHSLPLLYLKLPLLFLWQKWENKAFYLQGLTGKRLVNSRQRIITVMIFPIFLSYF